MSPHGTSVFVVLICWTIVCFASSDPPLQSYNVNINNTSVSGLSSGAFFAVQMHLAYSNQIIGAGVFAGGPYNCAQGNLNTALGPCMKGTPNVNAAISTTNSRVTSGQIDSTSNLANQKVYLYSGTQDTTVHPTVMNALQQYYENYVDDANILYENKIVSAHTQPTMDTATNPCTVSKSPYISYCQYDGAGNALNHIYGTLNPLNNGTLTGTMLTFDQTEFIANAKGQSIANTGYLYVPASCAKNETCTLHVAFHGCLQSYESVGNAYITESGYNEWADTNNMIILYPQTITSSINPQNPNGCWNWWGYNNDPSSYDIQSGSQMKMVYEMMQRISSGYVSILAPTNLTVTSSTSSSVSLSWTAVSGATGYNILRDNVVVNSNPITTTVYTDSNGLTSGTYYTYRVAALKTSSSSPPSAPVLAKTSGTPPPLSAPVSLSVTSQTNSSVTLTWSPVPGAIGYNIFRNQTQANSKLHIGTSFTDKGLTASTIYAYYVTAVSSNSNTSPPSNTVYATTSSGFICTTYTGSNYAQVSAGRAYETLGKTYAVGSNEYMGLYNTFVQTTLSEISPNYYVIGGCYSS